MLINILISGNAMSYTSLRLIKSKVVAKGNKVHISLS